MSEKELREAVEKVKEVQKYYGHYNFKELVLLLNLAQQYLDCKGFPPKEEEHSECYCHNSDGGIYECENCLTKRNNTIIYLCKLAHLKDKERVLELCSEDIIRERFYEKATMISGLASKDYQSDQWVISKKDFNEYATSLHQLLKETLNGK